MLKKWSNLDKKIRTLKNNYFLNMQTSNMKNIINEVNIAFDDSKYKKYFDGAIGQKIYLQHIDSYFVCCTFCLHLQKSSCHEYCFTCGKKTYTDCSALLPGTFSYADSYFDALGDDYTPWIFKTPCTSFECLDKRRYFKNFNSFQQSVTVENYEALEGIFMGISRGKRPCHICASVNLDIYNKCSDCVRNTENTPCDKITTEISNKYRAILGMIKYRD